MKRCDRNYLNILCQFKISKLNFNSHQPLFNKCSLSTRPVPSTLYTSFLLILIQPLSWKSFITSSSQLRKLRARDVSLAYPLSLLSLAFFKQIIQTPIIHGGTNVKFYCLDIPGLCHFLYNKGLFTQKLNLDQFP